VALTPSFMGAHAGLGFITVAGKEAVETLTLTKVAPTTVPRVATTMTLTGTGFKTGMVVRYWDGAGAFQGVHTPTSITPTSATVNLTPTAWVVGTGGVDVYLDGVHTEQLHFTIT
jgi:hypothetical protein